MEKISWLIVLGAARPAARAAILGLLGGLALAGLIPVELADALSGAVRTLFDWLSNSPPPPLPELTRLG